MSISRMISEKEKIDIRKISFEDLKGHMASVGEKTFRAKQIFEWLWQKSVTDFDAMSNLSVATRSWLKENFVIHSMSLDRKQVSSDKTIKSTFKLYDGEIIEGVLIPSEDRITACVSSQVGCSLSCKFCATGFLDRKRNLESFEIYDQVVMLRKQAEEHFKRPLTNIVYMGMGEPLLNYQNVIKSIEHITSPEGLGISTRRITVSTAGISKVIRKMGDDEVKFNLAVSLHAANDEKRNQIMAINETNNLKVLHEALKHYYKVTRNVITFEYIVFKDFNDTLKDAQELVNFTKQVPSKVNIIEYNPVANVSYLNTDEDKLMKFGRYLEDKGVNVTLRRSRGKDIDAACGQLAGKDKSMDNEQ